MAELANQDDQIDLLLGGARYGDAQDVRAALDDYKVSPDAADERGRTGGCFAEVSYVYRLLSCTAITVSRL